MEDSIHMKHLYLSFPSHWDSETQSPPRSLPRPKGVAHASGFPLLLCPPELHKAPCLPGAVSQHGVFWEQAGVLYAPALPYPQLGSHSRNSVLTGQVKFLGGESIAT